MDFKLNVKDYLIKEAKVLGRMDIVNEEDNISHVRFNKDIPRYTFKLNDKTVYFNVPKWKEISVNNAYEVSRFGDVRRKGKIKHLAFSKSPYCRVPLGHYKNMHYVHKLVLVAFIGYDDKVMRNECNHDDFNVENNNLFNLYWVTRRENILHYLIMNNKLFDYEGAIGKELNSKDGKVKVVGYDKDKYTLFVEFENTGNQREVSTTYLETGRPKDNYYELTSPTGDRIQTRSLNILKETFGIQGARFSEMLNNGRKNYKGWTVKRTTNNKIIGGNTNGES